MFRAMTHEGLAPNTVTYTTLIAALAKGKEPERAIQVLWRMRRDGVAANQRTYNSLLHACTSGPGQWEQARAPRAPPAPRWLVASHVRCVPGRSW